MTVKLKAEHIDFLVSLLANAAGNVLAGEPQDLFRDLVASAHLPKTHTLAIAGRWTGNVNIDARRLVEWAIAKGVNPEDPRYTTLGALLRAFLASQPSPEDARGVVALIFGYNLIPDKALTEDLRLRYNVPVSAATEAAAASDYGPEIEWRGPASDLELQGFFTPDPPWQDVGFLMRAMARASSVCRVEAGPITGSGFLVAPALVLTNYHVLRPDSGYDLQSSLAKMILRFGCFTTAAGDASAGKAFRAARILDESPVAELDFVLLEVEAGIRAVEAIEPAPLDLQPPPLKSPLNLLHHPGGDSMKLSTSGNGVTGVYEDRSHVQYVTRATQGSSGSPCFNDDWNVVALHHAQRARHFGSVREGVLIGPIHQRIAKYL